MWCENVKFNFKDEEYIAEVRLEERDYSYGQDRDGNRAQNQQSIKIIEINNIIMPNEEIWNWDEFSICFVDNFVQYDEIMNILEEEVNKGELN